MALFRLCNSERKLVAEYRRGRRKREVGSRSENLSRLGVEGKARLLAETALIEPYDRPRTRGDCKEGVRPCSYVGCKYNLYLDVKKNGFSIQYNFPDIEPHEMGVSCVLDVVDAAGHEGVTLDGVSEHMNLTRERTRQLEVLAIVKLEKNKTLEGHKTPCVKKKKRVVPKY